MHDLGSQNIIGPNLGGATGRLANLSQCPTYARVI